MSSPRLVRTRPSLQTAARLVGAAEAIELIKRVMVFLPSARVLAR